MASKRPVALASLFFAITASLAAQGGKEADKQAIAAAQRIGDFEAAGAMPFRMTAKFQTFDYRGQPVSNGTVQETFLRPGFRKREVKRGGPVDTFAPEDNVALGSDDLPSGGFLESLLFGAATSPTPSLDAVEHGKVEASERKIGEQKLRCIKLKLPAAKEDPLTYCVSEDKPVLRVTSGQYGFLSVYNKYLPLGDHLVPADVTILQGGKVRGTLKVVDLKAAPDLKEADFSQADAASAGSSGAAAKGKETAPVLVSQPQLAFPPGAEAKHRGGKVIVSLLVKEDGSIGNLDVLSAPADDLAEAAVACVSQYRFRPALRDGKPVSVTLTVVVNFQIS